MQAILVHPHRSEKNEGLLRNAAKGQGIKNTITVFNKFNQFSSCITS